MAAAEEMGWRRAVTRRARGVRWGVCCEPVDRPARRNYSPDHPYENERTGQSPQPGIPDIDLPARACASRLKQPVDGDLAHRQLFAYLGGMEIHFSPDVETRLQQVALANGKDAAQLVKDTVARMLENQARFVAGVDKGIAQADRGELIDHKDVASRINRLLEP